MSKGKENIVNLLSSIEDNTKYIENFTKSLYFESKFGSVVDLISNVVNLSNDIKSGIEFISKSNKLDNVKSIRNKKKYSLNKTNHRSCKSR